VRDQRGTLDDRLRYHQPIDGVAVANRKSAQDLDVLELNGGVEQKAHGYLARNAAVNFTGRA